MDSCRCAFPQGAKIKSIKKEVSFLLMLQQTEFSQITHSTEPVDDLYVNLIIVFAILYVLFAKK